jgi:hypothetical protein
MGWHLAVHCTEYMHNYFSPALHSGIYISAVTILEKKNFKGKSQKCKVNNGTQLMYNGA